MVFFGTEEVETIYKFNPNKKQLLIYIVTVINADGLVTQGISRYDVVIRNIILFLSSQNQP